MEIMADPLRQEHPRVSRLSVSPGDAVLSESCAKQPLNFEPNQSQTGSPVNCLTRSNR